MESPAVAWMATAIATIAIIFLFAPSKKSNKDYDRRPLRPKESVWGVFQHLYSGSSPFYLLKVSKEVSKVFTLPILAFEAIVVADGKVARKILDDPKAKKWIKGYEFINHVAMGETFFGSDTPSRYKHVRKSTLQAFSAQNVLSWGPVLSKCLQDWIDATLTSSDSTDIDVAEEMQKLTIDVIGTIGFNYKLSPTEIQVGVKSLQFAYIEFAQKSRKYPHRQLLGGLFYPEVRRAKQASRDLRQLAFDILQNYREHPPTDDGGRPILHYIVNDDEYMNDEERVCDIVVYFAGGYDTTSYTISWTLLELAKNPECQKWLRRELLKLPPDERRNCAALKNTIRESMRLHPTAAVGGIRITEQDIELEDNRVIPAKSTAMILTLGLQRDPDVFDEPDNFVPQRWENPSSEMNQSWLAFGTGRRSCVGQALAQAELQIVIGKLVAEFEWTVVEEGTVDYYVTLKTVGTILKATKVA